jgi:hypothetical protein
MTTKASGWCGSCGVREVVCQREGAGVSFEDLDARAARDLGPHRRRRLDREDAKAEPVAEDGRERAGPRPDVGQGHPRRRAQVTPYCAAPRGEPVPRDLANCLERRRGLIVVADPGHVVPPYCPAFGGVLPQGRGTLLLGPRDHLAPGVLPES